MQKRLNNLRRVMETENLEGFLVSKPENLFYLSGFCGDAGVLYITQSEAKLITDFRYAEQAAEEARGFETVIHGIRLLDTLKEVVAGSRIKGLGFEADFISYHQHQILQHALSEVDFIPTVNLIEKLRMVKDEEEIVILEKAVALADAAFEYITGIIKPGLSEREIAIELEYFLRKQGAEKPAFQFIVASGPRSSLPHGAPTSRTIQQGDLLTLDFGAVYQGYHSDITRTVVIGEASPEQEKIYNLVLAAQMHAIETISPGMSCRTIDSTAREVISAQGYGNYFGHALGHGVGLAIHEGPRFAQNDETTVEPGMVVTVEPGIYLPNWGGVRIEDMILVTKEGCRILTKAKKNLLAL